MQNHDIAQHGGSAESGLGDVPVSALVDVAPVDDSNDFADARGQAMRDAMWKGHGGFEIALAPVFFGGIGWLADGAIGITPILTIVFVVLGLVGSVANQYYRYQESMALATAERKELSKLSERKAINIAKGSRNTSSLNKGSTATAAGPVQSFGPVEYAEVDMTIDFGRENEAAS